MPVPRRFPPPWSIDEANDACFIVRDATGQALGYFYFEDEPGRWMRWNKYGSRRFPSLKVRCAYLFDFVYDGSRAYRSNTLQSVSRTFVRR
jgi:hypothetical protein